MSLYNIARELKEMRDGIGSISKRVAGEGKSSQIRESRPPLLHPPHEEIQQNHHQQQQQEGRWANLPTELLLDVIQRVEGSEATWPARRQVVACAAVCRPWREITKEVVMNPEKCGRITFPISLKQPGPRDFPIQCFIRRERATHTYNLYLGLSPALQEENNKLLLAAHKCRRTTNVDFVITLSSKNFSRASNTYVGKLRSNFIGTKFTIFDGQPPSNAAVLSNTRASRRLIHPRAPAGNYEIATIAYELNVLRTRGPRRMQCTMHSIPFSSLQENGTADATQIKPMGPTSPSAPRPVVLKNKAPRWHEGLQCWCLNFRGRVTVASVKNFQLVAAVDPGIEIPAAEMEKVVLQFGKIGKDIFTMDYRYPLSAFEAFAICLSSFDTKPACE